MSRTRQIFFVVLATAALLLGAAPSASPTPPTPLDSRAQPKSVNAPTSDSFSPVTFDDFNRTVASGWGTSSTGVAWSDDSLRQTGVTSSAAGNSMAVDGLNGRIDLGVQEPVFMRAGSGPWQNPEWTMTARFKVSVVPGTAADMRVAFWVFTDLPLTYGNGPHVDMAVSSDPARGHVVLDGTTGDPNRVTTVKTDWVANTMYTLKWGLTWGGQSKVKVWPSAGSEPTTWLLIRDGSHDTVTAGASTVLEPQAQGLLTANTQAWFDDIHFDPSNLFVDPPPPATQNQENGATSKDPVSTSSGAFLYHHTDVSIAGRGPFVNFSRSYNSGDTRSSRLGPGWTDSYNARLADPGDGSADLILERRDGSTTRYVASGGTFTASAAEYGTLVRNADSSFTMTNRDQTVWNFDPSGRFVSIADRYGNTSTLTYNASNQLASVSDPAGRGLLAFGYTNGYLTSLTDWAAPARTVQFQYDTNDRLWKVTDREGKTTTFAYDGTSSRLASITDARGDTAVTLTYDGSGRVATQKDAQGLATGDATTFGYVVNGDGTRVTTITEPVTSFEPTFHPTTVDSYDATGQIVSRVSHPSSTENLTESYTYDAFGDRTSITDARGNRTDYCYDVSYSGAAISGSRGNLTRQIGPAPTPGGNRPVTLMTHDSRNNVTQSVAPMGVPSGATVTCATNLSSINTAFATDFAFDAPGANLISQTTRFTDPDSGLKTAITKYEYGDAANPGLITRTIPPRGNTGGTPDYSYATVFTYFGSGSKAGMLATSADALGDLTSYDYDSVGRLLSRVDPLGNDVIGGFAGYHRTSFTYDKEDRPRTQSLPAPTNGGTPVTTETRYDEVGNPVVRIDGAAQVTTYAYDARDALFQVKESPNAWTDPASPPSGVILTEYAYDAAGNRTRVTRAKGDASNERVTDSSYDGRGLVRTETQYPVWPATSPTLVTTTSYDPDGNVLAVVDPLTRTTTNAYDALNRLASITYVDGVTPNVTFGYDANDNRTSMSDGTGSSTYAYDEASRLTLATTPGPKTVGYRYDLDGNRTKVIYPDSTAVTYTFNKASQLSSLLDWGSRSVAYTYWPDGLLKSTTNPDATVANYAYDNTRRLYDIAHTNAGGQYLDRSFYTFTSAGNVASVNHGVLAAQTGRPDGPNGQNGIWTGSYTSINETVPNDSTYLASPAGPVSPNYYQVSLGDVLPPMDIRTISFRCRIGKSGNNGGQTIAMNVELRQGLTVIYTVGYQSLGGVTEAGWTDFTGTVSDQNAPLITNFADLALRFTPTASGNGQKRSALISFCVLTVGSPPDATAATAYTYDRMSRLTGSTSPGSAPTYGYDAVGNRTSKILSGSTTYTYDRSDRLTAAGAATVTVDAAGNMTQRGTDTFSYDQEGRLKTLTVSGISESYTYDGTGLRFSRQVGAGTPIRYVTDSNRALPVTIDDGVRKYVYGIGLEYAVSGTTVEVYHADRLGSVRALSTGGSVTGTYTFDDWGNLAAQTGSSTQPFGFAGQARDATGLTYLRARYYDATLARLASRDRVSGLPTTPVTLNRYAYAADNPVTFVDPSGRWTVGVCAGFNFRVWIIGIDVSPVCVVASSSLQVGLTSAVGGGGAAGANASVSLVAHFSDADYIEDLAKGFTNAGGSAEIGGGVSGSGFWGSGRCDQAVHGATFGPSLGGGAEGHITETYTQVWGTFGATPPACSKSVALR